MRTIRKDYDIPTKIDIAQRLNGILLELIQPIKVDGKEVNSIEVKAPELQDFLPLGNNANYTDLAKATNISQDEILTMHVYDFTKLEALYFALAQYNPRAPIPIVRTLPDEDI